MVVKLDGSVDVLGSECFLAGTPVSMPDGSKVPIETVAVDDEVQSYDPITGELKPGRVTRVFTRQATHILDLHGTLMTPGHVTQCGRVESEDNPFGGQHIPIMDILRLDGALVRQDGSMIRAATACEVGSEGDRMIWAITGKREGGAVQVAQKGRIRLGTRHVLPDGREVSVHRLILEAGWQVSPDGVLVREPGDRKGTVFHWEFGDTLPAPEDYVLGRSCVSLDDIYAANDWEGTGSVLPAPAGSPLSDAAVASPQVIAMAAVARRVPNIPWRLKGITQLANDGTLVVDPDATPPAELVSLHADGPVAPTMRSKSAATGSRKQRRSAKAKQRVKARTQTDIRASVH